MPWITNPNGASFADTFDQMDWMGGYPDIVGNTPLTEGGVCMAMTSHLFLQYKSGRSCAEFLQWLRSQGAALTIMEQQTGYGMAATGTAEIDGKPSVSLESIVNSVRRTAEDELYGKFGFQSVDSPYLPSALGFFSRLPSNVVERHGDAACLYKPIYMASLGGRAHTIGAILDYGQNKFIFFDSNEGLVEFRTSDELKTFVTNVEDIWAASYTAYYIDTKS